MKGKVRTYSWVLRRKVKTSSGDCRDFTVFVREQVSRAKDLISFQHDRNQEECTISTQMECWSCGKSSPNRFMRNILLKFPDANVKEIRRVG